MLTQPCGSSTWALVFSGRIPKVGPKAGDLVGLKRSEAWEFWIQKTIMAKSPSRWRDSSVCWPCSAAFVAATATSDVYLWFIAVPTSFPPVSFCLSKDSFPICRNIHTTACLEYARNDLSTVVVLYIGGWNALQMGYVQSRFLSASALDAWARDRFNQSKPANPVPPWPCALRGLHMMHRFRILWFLFVIWYAFHW